MAINDKIEAIFGVGLLTGKRHEKIFRGKRSVPYLNLSVDYIAICKS